jgi:serine/threonine protein kinase/Tfp pilus assembly protein PilF
LELKAAADWLSTFPFLPLGKFILAVSEMKLVNGSKIGPYEIIAPIGAGGMGEVYKAYDPQLRRIAAVKILPERISAQSDALARLENEARLASSLNHPNIITIYSIGWEGQRRYIAMEFIDGPTLQELVDAGPLPVDRALSLSAQIADGLAKAHEAGIIHRDLKPKNVMVTKDGLAKILDFGLSKLSVSAVDSEAITASPVMPNTGLTQPGTILGTVEYMSPEQAAGGLLDFRSDQFSMGSLMYALLTGAKPFHRDTPVQTLSQIIEEDPPSVSKVNPQVYQPLDAIIHRCLRKDPGKRYASTRELAKQLHNLELSRHAPDRRWTRRKWIRASIGVGILLVAGSGLRLWFQRPYRPKETALKWYQTGQGALHSMTFDAARRAFEQAVEADPEFALAHASLAIAYDLLDYSERAKESMLRALSAAQETRLSGDDRMRLRALQFMVSREYDRAVPLLRQLEKTAANQEKPAAALEFGWLEEKREDTEAAAAAYELALSLDPGYAAARLRMGFIQQRRVQDELALKSFTEAEKLYSAASDHEGVTETLYQRANLLNRRSRAEEAMPTIEKALAIARAVDNRYQEIRLQLLQSAAARKLGQEAFAGELAQKAIDAALAEKMDTLAISGVLALGSAYFTRDDFEPAEKNYRTALDVAKRAKARRYEALASLSLGSLLEQKNQPEEAKKMIEAAAPFFRQAGYRRELMQSMTVLGGVFHQLGELDQGVKVLREALPGAVQLRDSRTELPIRERLIAILQDQGAWPEALQEAERALNVAGSGSQLTYVNLIRSGLYWRLGRKEDAERILSSVEQLLRKRPNPESLALLKLCRAEIAYGEGHFEKARAAARQATSAVPAAEGQNQSSTNLMEALLLIRTGRRSEGIRAALEIVQSFEKSKLLNLAGSARLEIAEALVSVNERALARDLVLQALDFCQQRMIWESVWRAHLICARSSQDPAEVESHSASARSALARLRELWPAEDVDRYLQRPDIKLLGSGMRF